jgi:hypothetical protein
MSDSMSFFKPIKLILLKIFPENEHVFDNMYTVSIINTM